MAPRYFENIHLLRAFAALSVVAYHVVEILPWRDFPSSGPLLWFRAGWMGVDLFFVISGFVIGLAAIGAYRARGPAFVADYVRHRVARIAPLYYLTLALSIAYTLVRVDPRDHFAADIAAHVLFVHNLHPVTHGSSNGVNWSVATEMQFYLAVCLAAPWLTRANPWRLLAGGVLASWAYRAVVWVAVTASAGDAHTMYVYSTQLPGMLDEFACGIFLARLVLDGERLTGTFPTWFRHPLFWATGAVLVFGTMWHVYLSNAEYWDDWRMVVFFRTAIGASFLFMVGAAVFLPTPAGLRRWVLPPFLYLGEISYGIYLWHVGVISGLKKLGIADPLWFLLAAIAGTLVLASLSWHGLERPLIRRFR